MLGLMNSCAAISWLVAPSAASRAIWASWGVRSSRVSTVRLRACSPVACSSTRGALGERLHADSREHLVGGAQLLARVEPPALAAQPFAVERVGAGELHADAGAARAARSPRDRGARRPRPRSAALASGPRSPAPSRCHWRVSSPTAAERVGGALGLAAADGRLDQLDQRPS